MSKEFDIPVLFIIYNRKDPATRVIKEISKVRPKKLFISQDGPKDKDDRNRVVNTREAVLSEINWDCEVVSWFHEENIGLTKHAPSAFSKVFKNENKIIYIEDDTLPNEDFFYFQREILEKYEKDKRIFSINGSNQYPEIYNDHSYYLSKNCNVWGMGLWKRSWILFKEVIDNKENIDMKDVRSYFYNKKSYFQLYSYWLAVQRGFDNWDFLFNYTAAFYNKYFIMPSRNLIKNIGINKESSSPFLGEYDTDLENIMPIDYPKELSYNRKIDIYYFDKLLRGGWLRLIGIRIYLISPPFMKSIIKSFTLKFIKPIF